MNQASHHKGPPTSAVIVKFAAVHSVVDFVRGEESLRDSD